MLKVAANVQISYRDSVITGLATLLNDSLKNIDIFAQINNH